METESLFDTNKLKKHDIPLDNFDYKFIEKCDNVKELEKIYRVLVSGVEGKYPDLENCAYEKLKSLAPNSRALRKDLPIQPKAAMPKSEQSIIESEIESFVKSIPSVEQKLINSLPNGKDSKGKGEKEDIPPIRPTKQVIIKPGGGATQVQTQEKPAPAKTQEKVSNKSVKPKDYREWEKIEKKLESELNKSDSEDEKKAKKDDSKIKVTTDKTSINQNDLAKGLLKNIPKEIEAEDLDDDVRTFKADQEKCKGNESFNAGCFEEALIYYSRSIQYLPNSASYNNRALTYIKLEKWDKAIEDCKKVLDYEKDNFKALLRRGTAYFKKKWYKEAKEDIDRCLVLTPNDKKAQEMQKDIEKCYKKELEDQEKLKSKGGSRLKIEETDGSSDDEEEVQVVDPKLTAKTKDAPKPTIDVAPKKQIKIAEVESDDEDEEDNKENIKKAEEEKPKSNPKQESKSENAKKEEKAQTTAKPVELPKKEIKQEVKSENVKAEEKVEPKADPVKELPKKEAKQYDLPKSVIDIKDKANTLFGSGQYGEAVEKYSKAIEKLKKIPTKDEDEDVFYKNNLAVLYNNRASSFQRICDYKSCVNDCNSALDLIESMNETQTENLKGLKLKILSKKGDSFEKLEKYMDAYLEYEKIMKLDITFKNAQTHYNRLRNILKDNGQLKNLNSSSKKESTEQVKPSETKAPKEEPKPDKEKLYEEYKTKGNDSVKQNDYAKALEFYSKCIEIDSVNTVAYLNRSLCYVKMNKPDLAIQDSTFVLEKDKDNVKALFRRAMAFKIKLDYDAAINDLNKIVRLEKNNQIAIQELKDIEQSKKALNEMNRIKSTAQKVTEVKSTPAPAPAQTNAQTNKKITVISESDADKSKEKEEREVKKPEPTPKATSAPPKPVLVEPKVLKIAKVTNAYEFLQAYNSINPKDTDSYCSLITKVSPTDLPKFIGSKLDDSMLKNIIIALHKIAFDEEKSKLLEHALVDYLKSLTKSQRFNVIKLFMSQEQKTMLNELFGSKHVGKDEANAIKNLYDI